MEVDALIISNTPSVTAQGLGTKEGAAKYVRHLNHTTPILFLNSSLPFMVTERVMATEYWNSDDDSEICSSPTPTSTGKDYLTKTSFWQLTHMPSQTNYKRLLFWFSLTSWLPSVKVLIFQTYRREIKREQLCYVTYLYYRHWEKGVVTVQVAGTYSSLINVENTFS